MPRKAQIEPPLNPEQNASSSPPLAVSDHGFLETLVEQLGGHKIDKNVLLNVPIWGWTGDGKTCALLTAIHFADPARHPFGFALVTDPEELLELERTTPAYQGLNLAGIAAATTARLRRLMGAFIDNNEWPPGTDEPSAYVLGIRSLTSTLGYVIFPDITGGSFRELDQTARDVLRRPHAAAILVNPELYQQRATDGKRYRDEILVRVQQFTGAGVPVCVMITKADLYQGADEKADTTHQELTAVLDSQKDLKHLLCRISVIGSGPLVAENKLPSAIDRRPDNLVGAWIWVVAQALLRPAKEVRNLLPSLNLRTGVAPTAPQLLESVPEFRRVAEFSTSPGLPLCPSEDDTSQPAMTFVSERGELVEVALDLPSEGQPPQQRTVGNIPDWSSKLEVSAYYMGGEYVIGTSRNCNHIWHGPKGGPLSKTPLPSEMVSWSPVAARHLVGIDSAGRLHSLQFDAAKWYQRDYLENFSASSLNLACAFVENAFCVFVFNGTSVEALALLPDGKLGARVVSNVVVKFDSPRTVVNRLGTCVAISTAGQAVASSVGKGIELGPVKADSRCPVAIAPLAPFVAVAGPDLKLAAVSLLHDGAKRSNVALTQALQTKPVGMVWTRRGELLVVATEDGTWGVYRPLGLGE